MYRPTLWFVTTSRDCLFFKYIFTADSVQQATVYLAKYTEQDARRSKAKLSNLNRAKSREVVDRPLPVVPESSSSSEEDAVLLENLNKLSMSSGSLETYDQEISLVERLQPFEDTLTPEQRKRRVKKKVPKKSKNKKAKEREEQRKRQVYEAIKSGNLEELKGMLENFVEQLNTFVEQLNTDGTSQSSITKHQDFEAEKDKELRNKFFNEVLDEQGNSLLHLASLHEQQNVVEFLLENDANPCLRNTKQQTPYTISQNKEIREVFKQFAQEYPEKYNYNKVNKLNTFTYIVMFRTRVYLTF